MFTGERVISDADIEDGIEEQTERLSKIVRDIFAAAESYKKDFSDALLEASLVSCPYAANRHFQRFIPTD